MVVGELTAVHAVAAQEAAVNTQAELASVQVD